MTPLSQNHLMPHSPPTQGRQLLLSPETRRAQVGNRTRGTSTCPPLSIQKSLQASPGGAYEPWEINISDWSTSPGVLFWATAGSSGLSGGGHEQAHLYDKLMESADLSSALQTLQILVKYSCSMKDLLKKIQKLMPPRGTPRWMLDPGPPGSPTATLYEVIGEVKLVLASQTGVGPSQLARTPKPPGSGNIPDREKTPVPERTRLS